MSDLTFLVTVEAHIETEATPHRTMEDIIRHCQWRDGIHLQDIDELDMESPTEATAHIAISVPLSGDFDEDECEEIIREELKGEEYGVCRGFLLITQVFEVVPFERRD